MIFSSKSSLLNITDQKKTLEGCLALLEDRKILLVTSFLELIEKVKVISGGFNDDFKKALGLYNRSLNFVSSKSILNNLQGELKESVSSGLKGMKGCLPRMIKLAEVKESCSRLSKEILKVEHQICVLKNRVELVEKEMEKMQNRLNEKEKLNS